jgi:hypothetical protein
MCFGGEPSDIVQIYSQNENGKWMRPPLTNETPGDKPWEYLMAKCNTHKFSIRGPWSYQKVTCADKVMAVLQIEYSAGAKPGQKLYRVTIGEDFSSHIDIRDETKHIGVLKF